MRPDELKKLAADGNLAAAEVLGDHYQEEKDYAAALYYYEMAAQDSNNWVVAYNAMMAARMVACEYMQERNHREATAYFLRTIKWAKNLCEGKLSTQIEGQYKDYVRNSLSGSIYLYCLASYVQDNMYDILAMLPDPKEIKTKLLCGVALQRTAVTLEDYQVAFDFQAVVENRTFKPEFWEEHVFFCEAAVNMASFYQTGLSGRVAKDLVHAVDILKSAIDRVSLPQTKEALQEELSKYRPKFFGGYTYIG